jgi:hypothetical protein
VKVLLLSKSDFLLLNKVNTIKKQSKAAVKLVTGHFLTTCVPVQKVTKLFSPCTEYAALQ